MESEKILNEIKRNIIEKKVNEFLLSEQHNRSSRALNVLSFLIVIITVIG